MNTSVLNSDLSRLRLAVLRVVEASRAESEALRAMGSSGNEQAIQVLRDSHMVELDAIQAMAAALELMDRRLTR